LTHSSGEGIINLVESIVFLAQKTDSLFSTSKLFLTGEVCKSRGVACPTESAVSKSIVLATVADVELESEPIPADWVLSGEPKARIKKLAVSHDWTSSVVVWDCTAGRFHWHYGVDESVFVLSGEAFMLKENGEERRFGAGDMGFFPAGTSCTWRVPDGFKKVAVLRETMWRPLGICLKAAKKLLRILGLSGKSALVIAFATWISSNHL
jgi:hypothetical protein